MEDKKLKMPHNLVLEDRKTLSLTGVSDVDSFDESTVIVYTDLGELTVRGENLHIKNLDITAGEVSLEGRINALEYTDDTPHSTSLFGRIFR